MLRENPNLRVNLVIDALDSSGDSILNSLLNELVEVENKYLYQERIRPGQRETTAGHNDDTGTLGILHTDEEGVVREAASAGVSEADVKKE
jgi:hypothetical protein